MISNKSSLANLDVSSACSYIAFINLLSDQFNRAPVLLAISSGLDKERMAAGGIEAPVTLVMLYLLVATEALRWSNYGNKFSKWLTRFQVVFRASKDT